MLEGGGTITNLKHQLSQALLLVWHYYLKWNRLSFILPSLGFKLAGSLLSVLFNMVINHLLRSLPREFSLRFGGVTTTIMAFADDMNLKRRHLKVSKP